MIFRAGWLAVCALSFGLMPAFAQEDPATDGGDGEAELELRPVDETETAAFCAGYGADGVWIGGSPETSDISMAEGPLDMAGVAIPSDGDAVVVFSVSVFGPYRVEALPEAGGDTVIDLYSEDGQVLLTDDDSGGRFASRGEIDLQPGTYCLATRGFFGAALTADIRVGRAEHEPITGGLDGGTGSFSGAEACLPDTEAVILGGDTIDAFLAEGVFATNSVVQAPYYRFVLGSPQALTIRAENEASDPYIYLYDGRGTLIAENDDFDGLNSRMEFTDPLPAGTYCLGMRSLRDPQLQVTVSIRGYDPQEAIRELYISGDASPPIGGSYPITDLGTVSTRVAQDQRVAGAAVWYQLEVPEASLLLIDAIELTDSDPVIRLFDAAGRLVAFNDDAGNTLNSQIAQRVAPGTYLLGVTQYSENYQGVIRVTIERFVPAQ